MTYRYLNTAGDKFYCANYVFQAVAENEISSMFDCAEECAETSISVIVSDKESGEQIATIDHSAFFWFSEGYSYQSKQWCGDAFHFDLEQESIALADHEWDPTETTAEEVEALAGGWNSHFWAQVKRASESLCISLENTVRDMRYEDLSETVNLPEYSLPYLFNADPSGLSEEDIKAIDEWYESLERDGFSKSISVLGQDTPEGPAPYFCSNPAFGLPAQCVKACIGYTPNIS